MLSQILLSVWVVTRLGFDRQFLSSVGFVSLYTYLVYLATFLCFKQRQNNNSFYMWWKLLYVMEEIAQKLLYMTII